MYINKECPVCHTELNQITDTDYGHCVYCGYDEHDEEVKGEVVYIIEYALNHLKEECRDNLFGVPNGSLWSYDCVLNYVKKNLKSR